MEFKEAKDFIKSKIDKIKDTQLKFKEACMIRAIQNGKDIAFWCNPFADMGYDDNTMTYRMSAKEIDYELTDQLLCDCCGQGVGELAGAEIVNLHDLNFIAVMSDYPINDKLKGAEKAWLKTSNAP